MAANRTVPKVVCQFTRFPSRVLSAAHRHGLIRLVQPTEHTFALENKIADSARSPMTHNDTFPQDSWLRKNLPGAEGALLWVNAVPRFGEEWISIANKNPAGTRLKVAVTYSAGTDHIDLEACRRAGVSVGHTPFASDDAVANATITMMLSAMRRSQEHSSVVRSSRWKHIYHDTSSDPTTLCGTSPQGLTIGFYGFGGIAQKVAERVLSMQPSTILYTTTSARAFSQNAYPRLFQLQEQFYQSTRIENEPDLSKMTRKADVLVILAPLTHSTRGAISKEVLAGMKSSALLVNLGRGQILDTEALVQALKEDRLAGAALDVLEGEPLIDASHPLLAPDLRDKVLVWPHSGSAELATRLNMCEMAARNVLAGLGLLEEAKRILPSSVWKTRQAFEPAQDDQEDGQSIQPDYSTHFVV